jgi:hypothetical protein
MKGFFPKSILFLLAGIILVTGTGFTLSQMICLGSGKITTRFYAQEDCCKKPTAPVSIKAKCCDLKNQELKLNTFKVPTFNPEQVYSFILLAPLQLLYFFNPLVSHNTVQHFSHAPPLVESGTEILHRIQLLLI